MNYIFPVSRNLGVDTRKYKTSLAPCHVLGVLENGSPIDHAVYAKIFWQHVGFI